MEEHYYRAVSEFLGNEVTFVPSGYYENVDDNGEVEWFHGEPVESAIPETVASKTIEGAVAGMASMENLTGTHHRYTYIYRIDEKPDKDLSNSPYLDFKENQEVRYARAVKAVFVGEAPMPLHEQLSRMKSMM